MCFRPGRNVEAMCRLVLRAARSPRDRVVGWSVGLAILVGLVQVVSVWGGGWPTYGYDAARSGITNEAIALPLEPCWVYEPRFRPEPAWGSPKPLPVEDILELRRAHFDDVFHVAAADGSVWFGSSATGKVLCLEAASGRPRWAFPTGGPVRLAPTVVDGRVYVGSDDGWVYCLAARDGSVIWKRRGAPEDRRVLGSGRMISLYPVRTGVLVDEGVAYFAAGIFPTEGVFLYAVDARDGREIWRQDTFGETAFSQASLSPQGYLLASKSTLYAPMGRVSPAAFDRRDGRLRSAPFFGKTIGGTYALLAGSHVYTGTEQIVAYNPTTQDRFATFNGRKMVVTTKTAFLATAEQLIAMDRASPGAKSTRWKIDCACPDALILAGDTLLAGGDGRVVAVAADSGRVLWQADVQGKAKGLAVADGRLLVSADSGKIYSFAPKGTPSQGIIRPPAVDDPYEGRPTAALFRQAAETIIDRSNVRRGYALVLGCETGQLALELARRTDLTVYAVSPDAQKVEKAREAIDAAGVYGARVLVEQWPLCTVPYGDYFANLIVSETAMLGGALPPADEVFRMLKPVGGVALIGQPETIPEGTPRLAPQALASWVSGSPLAEAVASDGGGHWLQFTRGPLPGAGSWTHQYANPGNTAAGDDTRVKAPLGVLWFGQPGPERMVQRHSRAAGPLSGDGRLFVEGEGVVMAYDVYNGIRLWERELDGASAPSPRDVHRGSNLALGPQGLFVVVNGGCLRLDPATGETLATYPLPPGPGAADPRWGYVACVGERLYGSWTVNGVDSSGLFALDVASGKKIWDCEGQAIPHNTIAIDAGRLFLVSRAATEEDRREILAQQRRRIDEQLPESLRPKALHTLEQADVRMVVALDAETGRRIWQRAADVSRLPGKSRSQSEDQAAMVHNGVLVLFGVYLDGHHWKEFFAGDFDLRRITALDAATGELLWERRIGFRVRPVILGDTLHAEPWAFDLRTGEPKTRIHPVTGREDPWQFARPGHHCGCPVGSPNALFFRSWFLGCYDLIGDYGTTHFGGQRPGCWINFIPAGGVLLMPEASAGCMCPFPTVCSIAFYPVEQNKSWALYSAPGPLLPVQRLALNLGVEGDRNDASGKLWLGYPRPKGSLVLQLDLTAEFYPGGQFTRHNSNFTPIQGSDDPWLFASAAEGLKRLRVPLRGPADHGALYRVRLAMAAPEGDRPGQRRFDIKLQGRLVAQAVDIVSEAGQPGRALVRQFDDISVERDLTVELVAHAARPTRAQWPLLNGIEIFQQRALSPDEPHPKQPDLLRATGSVSTSRALEH